MGGHLESKAAQLADIDRAAMSYAEDDRSRAWLAVLHAARDNWDARCFDSTLPPTWVGIDERAGRVAPGNKAMSWRREKGMRGIFPLILESAPFLAGLNLDRPPHRQRAADVILHELIHVALFEEGHHEHWHGPLFVAECDHVGALLGLPEVPPEDADFWPKAVRPDGFYEDALPPDWRRGVEAQRRRMAARRALRSRPGAVSTSVNDTEG